MEVRSREEPTMNASFEQMREIFLGAVEEPSPAQREAYLDRA